MKFRTGGDELEYVWWEIEIPWKMRREILQTKAIELNMIGGMGGFVADTAKIREIMWPEAIRGWGPDSQAGSLRHGSEEEFWSTPMGHLDGLAIQVAEWLVTGVEPTYEDKETDGGLEARPTVAGENAENDNEQEEDVAPLRSV